MRFDLGRVAVVCALGAVAVSLAGAAPAPASDERAAVEAVRALIRTHARVCGLSLERLRATRLGDPLDLSHTLAYRIDAKIDRVAGQGRTAAFAAWELANGVATPVSPLAGEIVRGCTLRDPVRLTGAGGWRGLPYLDYDSGDLDVTTSTAWRGAALAGKAITSDSRPLWAQPLQPIWTTSCTRETQHPSFTRTLFLPGRPASAAIAVRTTRVDSVELLVNRHVVARVRRREGVRRLSARALALFRYGANRVELSATKSGSSPCIRGGHKVGISAELTGVFRADSGLPPSGRFVLPHTERIGDLYYRRAGGADAGAMEFTVVDNGPSDIPSMTFVVHVAAGARVALAVRGHRCRRRDATSRLAPPFGTLCVLRDVSAGTPVRLDVAYRFKPRRVPFDEEETYLTWAVQGPWDANPHNQQQTVTLTFCGARSTSAACKRAP